MFLRLFFILFLFLSCICFISSEVYPSDEFVLNISLNHSIEIYSFQVFVNFSNLEAKEVSGICFNNSYLWKDIDVNSVKYAETLLGNVDNANCTDLFAIKFKALNSGNTHLVFDSKAYNKQGEEIILDINSYEINILDNSPFVSSSKSSGSGGGGGGSFIKTEQNTSLNISENNSVDFNDSGNNSLITGSAVKDLSENSFLKNMILKFFDFFKRLFS